ncbi:hypothetical protein BDZ89DRAFT_1140239 [Hymenopellis radicata]|nr:hypothetical protein BDZ89DRAFT_1140239 [Hymenopellis radicata]
MLQMTRRSLVPRCIPKPRPIQPISALQKRTLGTSSTRVKLPRVSIETQASLKDKAAFSAANSSTARHHHLHGTPFLTDTAWPDGLLTIFRNCRQERGAYTNQRYCGPYNKLLTYCFGPNSYEFFVAPEAPYEGPPGETCADDYVFIVVYDQLRRPVMIADIKGDGWVGNAEYRLDADEHMRWWFELMAHDCPLPRFWGLSLLGTSLRVYRVDVATCNMNPDFSNRSSVKNSSGLLSGDFLAGAWNIDILSQEGFDKMKEIQGDIAESAAALR